MRAVTRTELEAAIAARTGYSKSVITDVIDQLLGDVRRHLANGESVSLYGFGKFDPRQTADRRIRDVSSGEMITVPGRMKVGFQPGATLNRAVTDPDSIPTAAAETDSDDGSAPAVDPAARRGVAAKPWPRS